MSQFLEMNLSFELQYLMLLKQVLEEAPRQRRGWRVYTRGSVSVLRKARGREPERTLTSILVVKQETWTEVTWMGQRFRWSEHVLETDEGVRGCDSSGEVFFERRTGSEMRCWNAAGVVSCEGVSIPPKDRESAMDALMSAFR